MDGVEDRPIRRLHGRGVELTLAALLLVSPSFEAAPYQPQKPAPPVPQLAHHKFFQVAMGRALPANGAREASVQSFQSEDGTLVTQLRQWYLSADEAQVGLDKLTERSSRVIQRGAKPDSRRGGIGRRVVLVFERGHKKGAEFIIAWTDGATTVRLGSASLSVALDFESQFYH